MNNIFAGAIVATLSGGFCAIFIGWIGAVACMPYPGLIDQLHFFEALSTAGGYSVCAGILLMVVAALLPDDLNVDDDDI